VGTQGSRKKRKKSDGKAKDKTARGKTVRIYRQWSKEKRLAGARVEKRCLTPQGSIDFPLRFHLELYFALYARGRGSYAQCAGSAGSDARCAIGAGGCALRAGGSALCAALYILPGEITAELGWFLPQFVAVFWPRLDPYLFAA